MRQAIAALHDTTLTIEDIVCLPQRLHCQHMCR